MLVLSRKTNERVFVLLPDGTEIVVTVMQIDGTKTRIGFQAPGTIEIHRAEVLARIRAEQEEERAAS